MATCSVGDCARKVLARGWCTAHYQRWRKYGDPLAGFQGKTEWQLRGSSFADATERECAKCGITKPVDEFHRDKHSASGRHSSCKVCRTATESERYWQDPERFKEKERLYRSENLDYVRAKEREHYHANPERPIAAACGMVAEKRSGVTLTYRERQKSIEWRLTTKDDACFYCGATGEMQWDHYYPVSRGGSDHWLNIVRACADCNGSSGKRDRLASQWHPAVNNAYGQHGRRAVH